MSILVDHTASELVSAYQLIVYEVHKCRTKSWIWGPTLSPLKMACFCQVVHKATIPYRLDHCQNGSLSNPLTRVLF